MRCHQLYTPQASDLTTFLFSISLLMIARTLDVRAQPFLAAWIRTPVSCRCGIMQIDVVHLYSEGPKEGCRNVCMICV